MKKIFLLLTMFLSIITVKAYKNDYFEISIPNDYKLTTESNNIYKWDKDNNYIAITLVDNSETKYNIKYFSDYDIDQQKYYIEQSINTKLSEYNIYATINSIKKYNVDDLYYLEYDLYLPSKKAIGYNTYQIGRVYSTNKYLISVLYNSDKEINKEEFDSFINTFIINDITIDRRIKNLIIITIVTGIILGIIGYILSVKKKKH